jgi:hypothetical protein
MNHLPNRVSDIRVYSQVTLGALLIGGVGTLVYERLEWSCPMKTVGLACPGCGCGQAAKVFFDRGPIEAFHVEPTAIVFLVSLLLLVTAWKVKIFHETALARNLVLIAPIGLGFTNLAFQLLMR